MYGSGTILGIDFHPEISFSILARLDLDSCTFDNLDKWSLQFGQIEKEWRSADRDPPLLGRPSPITPRLYISHSTFHKSENVEFTFCPYFSSQKRQILTINQCIAMINQCLFFETTNKGFLIKEA